MKKRTDKKAKTQLLYKKRWETWHQISEQVGNFKSFGDKDRKTRKPILVLPPGKR
jgi:hypothetical protein